MNTLVIMASLIMGMVTSNQTAVYSSLYQYPTEQPQIVYSSDIEEPITKQYLSGGGGTGGRASNYVIVELDSVRVVPFQGTEEEWNAYIESRKTYAGGQ
jgi:hypothetical protein